MKVKQIGLEFRAIEDRMLLRVATDPPSNLGFWITRRYFKLMWEALVQALERQLSADHGLNEQTRQAVVSMERQARVQKLDFSQPFQAPPAPAEEAAPVNHPLLYGLTVKHRSPNAWQLALLFGEKRQAELNLNNEMLLSLMALMQRTIASADWSLSLRGLESMVAAPEPSRVVH